MIEKVLQSIKLKNKKILTLGLSRLFVDLNLKLKS